ncbi:transposase, partial [Mesorhizobium sp. M1406]|uniref:transposase n=1 Tax=Mesorhizobium sp. M1406 TaxID=2957099 RepID=UPI00333E0B06
YRRVFASRHSGTPSYPLCPPAHEIPDSPSSFAVAQFDTLRLRLIKIAARVVEMKTQIRLHLPTSCPDQRILRIVLDRIPQLVT